MAFRIQHDRPAADRRGERLRFDDASFASQVFRHLIDIIIHPHGNADARTNPLLFQVDRYCVGETGKETVMER
jgi:hypothetical protein